MNESVMEEVLKRCMVEMGDDMKGLVWKIERSRDISQEGLKSIVLKGFESMTKVMERVIKNIGERMAEERRRRDSVDREIEERLCRMEERIADKGVERGSDERRREERIQEMERKMEEGKVSNGRREERLQMLEKHVKKEEEGVRKVCAEVTAWVGKVEALMEEREEKERQDRLNKDERMEQEREERERLSAVEASLKALEITVKEKEGDERKGRLCAQEKEGSEEVSEDGRRVVADREEKERILAEKISRVEEGLERERRVRMRREEERRIEREERERNESIKQMERKVCDAMVEVKILNLRFGSVSKAKGELLKEAEGIIKGKVDEKDRKECEWILRKSRLYVLGEGTGEKEVGKERIYTAPVLIKCGSHTEKERMEGMLRTAGVRVAFHWPREMLEFVDEVRGWVEEMGYMKDVYFTKVRPYKVDGVPQLRAEVKRKDGKGGGFKRVGSWSCPPLDRELWWS
jgi:predicted metal-dependent phosphoesterase TrpH